MNVPEREYKALERDVARLFRELKKGIGDDYRASDDPDDDKPGMSVTIGATLQEDGTLTWSYQTGDNSYTGGAYGHRHWGVVSLYRKSKSRDLAADAVNEIADSISQME